MRDPSYLTSFSEVGSVWRRFIGGLKLEGVKQLAYVSIFLILLIVYSFPVVELLCLTRSPFPFVEPGPVDECLVPSEEKSPTAKPNSTKHMS